MNIFVVSTPYHLILACSMKKSDDILIVEDNDFMNDEKMQYFMNKYFEKKPIIINNHCRIFKNVLLAKKNFKNIVKLFKKENVKNVFGFDDADPIVQFIFNYFKLQANCIILEEGIGLYNDVRHNYTWLKKIYGKIIFGSWYEIVHRIGSYKFTSTIYAKKPQLLNEMQKGKIIVNYKYEELKTFIENEKMEVNNRVWFLGQPLIEDRICSQEEYLECLKNCIKITQKYGEKLIVKVHPRENIEKYKKYLNDVELYDNKNIPFELLLGEKSENILITISSSSVLNFEEYKNVIPIFLYNLVKTNIPFSTIAINYNNINVINNWKELDKILGNKKIAK